MPNSSSNSGSALEAPRIRRSNESSKLRPKAAEAFLAPTASFSSCSGENPFATPIAAASAASRNPNIPPLASRNPAVTV